MKQIFLYFTHYLYSCCGILLLLYPSLSWSDGKLVVERVIDSDFDYTYTVNGLTVSYQYDLGADSLCVEWDFGDGFIANTEHKVAHTFKTGGTYFTCLTIRHVADSHNIIKKCKYVELSNPGICDWNWQPVCGCDNQTYFNACVAGNIHGVYSWVKGECKYIVLELMASYLYNPTKQLLTYQFINSSEGNYDQFAWNFSDGTRSTARNPVHTFTKTGSYQVCITVTSSITHQTSTFCENVNVE